MVPRAGLPGTSHAQQSGQAGFSMVQPLPQKRRVIVSADRCTCAELCNQRCASYCHSAVSLLFRSKTGMLDRVETM